MKYPRASLIQFAKSPVAGRVKTRLSPSLDEFTRLALHQELVRHSYQTLVSARLAEVEVWTTSAYHHDRSFWQACGISRCRLQQGGDLGEKMHNSFDATLGNMAQKEMAVLVGSDCPFITPAILDQALSALSLGNDAVFGPALDGGYYLVGLKKPEPRLFQNIPWGTSAVYWETLKKLSVLGLQFAELPVLGDIDRPADLALLHKLPVEMRQKFIKFVTD